MQWSIQSLYGPRGEKTCLQGFANNTGADQPAHPRSLISAFVIHFLESFISRLATSEISIFELVSVAEQVGLNLTLSKTPETGFVAARLILYSFKENYIGLKWGISEQFYLSYIDQSLQFFSFIRCKCGAHLITFDPRIMIVGSVICLSMYLNSVGCLC